MSVPALTEYVANAKLICQDSDDDKTRMNMLGRTKLHKAWKEGNESDSLKNVRSRSQFNGCFPVLHQNSRINENSNGG